MKMKKTVKVPIREEIIIKKVASKSVILATACVFLILGIGLTAGYFVVREVNSQGMTPAEKEVKMVTEQVGRLALLPAETPTIATVDDVTKLSDKTFFAHAENGDKVLFFAIAKKAILYRPTVGKIVEMGPVVPNTPTSIITDVTIAPSPTITPISKKKISK